jgi:Na+-driven multidrug efflux pump
MILPSAAVLVTLVGSSQAFGPAAKTSRSTISPTTYRSKQRDFSLRNDKILAEPIEPRDEFQMNIGETSFEESFVEFPLVPESTGTLDAQAELLLDTIENTKPEDIDIVFDVAEQTESIFPEITMEEAQMAQKTIEEQVPQEQMSSVDMAPSSLDNVLSGTEYADFGNTSILSDDLKAVLEASGVAAAEAEASMPPDLVEQLDFSQPTNATSTISSPLVVDEVPEILPASSVVGEAVTSTTKIESPSVMKILKFAIPAIGVWLCGPLLSLIDTSAVGLFSGTVQQAALNPAVAVTDYAALLIAFMYTGTTNLVAAAQESDRVTADKPSTTKTLVGAMQLSTYVGAGLGAFLFIFARPLLRAIIGNDAISPAVFAAAMKYVRIRALGMPAAAIIGSTQAACLGMQDIKSPLYVLVAAAVANFFGDIFFVGNSHPWVGGAAGAAWATVFSQYVGVAMFVRWLTHKPEKTPAVMNLSNAILEMTGEPSTDEGQRRQQGFQESLKQFTLKTHMKRPRLSKLFSKLRPKKSTANKPASSSESFSVRGFLQNKFAVRDLMKPPSKETRSEFAPYLVPVTTTQVGRVSGYVAMSHVVASSLGTVSMAAQQVIVSLFYCLTPIADSLSLTAQSFLPAISERPVSKERSAALKKTATSFLKAGGVFGIGMMAVVSAIPLLTGFFTADLSVISLVNSVVPLLLAFFGIHGFLCSSEGLLLGQKDLNFLGRMYGSYFFVVPYLMLKVKSRALAGDLSASLISVWRIFLGYQVVRAATWVARVFMLQRRTDRESRRVESQAIQDMIAP